jgi:NitT/TauT family transport system ATP-binding protein
MAGALSIHDAGKAYGNGTVALERCSMALEPGELRVIVGPSGCGKTTLLNAVAGFDRLTSGAIELDGVPVAAPGADRVMVFQHSSLFPWRTVVENVIYGPVVQRRLTRSAAVALARERLAQAGLADVADHYPGALSSGVQRRVELVRALVNEPRVLLLDEPFRGMDGLTRSVMHESLLAFYDRAPVTVLFITHDIEEAVFLGTRVSVMTSRPGRIKETIDVPLERPRDLSVLSAPVFGDVVARVNDAVDAEARHAFAVGERELA